MMTTQYGRWFGARALLAMLVATVVGCGGTGGGGGSKGSPSNQFVLNSSNSGRLILNVNPAEVDANKTDRIGLVATLTDSRGVPIFGATITFFSDIPDIRFIPGDTDAFGTNFGIAVTDTNGNADIIAAAGAIPTGTGDIIGTGAIFAQAPAGFGLSAQVQVTLFDVGFIDADELGIVPEQVTLNNPILGSVIFFNIVGGTPPYLLQNEVGTPGRGALGSHCLPGCTENGGVLCVGSACQSDSDCNEGGSPTPEDVCQGAIKRCLASCRGSNCAGARCDTDADCNDGSPTPANVCKDSGQAIAYTVAVGCGNNDAEDIELFGPDAHNFQVVDSAGDSVQATVSLNVAEACDGSDLKGQTCNTQGFNGGGTLACTASCTFDTSGCSTGGGGGTPGPGATFTPGGGVATATPTPGAPTASPTPSGPAPTPTPGIGAPTNLSLALLTNGSGDNGNGTLTTIIAATVTDSLGNPVPNGTQVTFSITAPTNGAAVSSPSNTNTNPPCDVTNFETDTGVNVLNQPGVAHSCITYPLAQQGTLRTINGVSGAASDSQVITLPPPPAP